MLRCPTCQADLVVRIWPDLDHLRSTTWCSSCDASLEIAWLVAHGLPAEIGERLLNWATHVQDILPIGCCSADGAGMPDGTYLEAWRAARDETLAVVRDVKAYVPAELEVQRHIARQLADVRASDARILAWRVEKARTDAIFDYGTLHGQLAVDRGDARSLPLEAIPVPHASVLASDSDRATYREGFVLGRIFGYRGTLVPGEESRLERLFGVR